MRVFSTCPVSIVKFWNVVKFGFFSTVYSFTHRGLCFRLCNLENQVHNTTIQQLLHELLSDLVSAAEVLRFRIQGLFGLTVKSRVHDETIHKDREILLDLMRLDVELLLVFLCQLFLDFGHNLVDDVLYMCATFGCANGVDEGYLLKSPIAQAAENFPSVTWRLCNLRQLLHLLILHVQVHILLKVLDVDLLTI